MFKGVMVPRGPCAFSLPWKPGVFFAEYNTAFSSIELCFKKALSGSVLFEFLLSLRLWSRKDWDQEVTEFTGKWSLMSKRLKYFATTKLEFCSLLRKMSALVLSLEENIDFIIFFFKLSSIILFLVLVTSGFCLSAGSARKPLDKLSSFWQIRLLTTLRYTA